MFTRVTYNWYNYSLYKSTYIRQRACSGSSAHIPAMSLKASIGWQNVSLATRQTVKIVLTHAFNTRYTVTAHSTRCKYQQLARWIATTHYYKCTPSVYHVDLQKYAHMHMCE